MTVGQLKAQLEDWPDEMDVMFSDDGLQFYRFKQRGENLLQMEFDHTVSRNRTTGEIVFYNTAPVDGEPTE